MFILYIERMISLHGGLTTHFRQLLWFQTALEVQNTPKDRNVYAATLRTKILDFGGLDSSRNSSLGVECSCP